LPRNADLALFYRWAQDQTTPDAVFILDPRPEHRVAMCGNIAEFPAITGRVIFTENLSHYMVASYPDASKRFNLAVRLLAGEEPNSADQAYLATFHRPIYLVHYQVGDNSLIHRMQSFYGPPVFHVGDVHVFKWQVI